MKLKINNIEIHTVPQKDREKKFKEEKQVLKWGIPKQKTGQEYHAYLNKNLFLC